MQCAEQGGYNQWKDGVADDTERLEERSGRLVSSATGQRETETEIDLHIASEQSDLESDHSRANPDNGEDAGEGRALLIAARPSRE
jgi:hypothetical protein